MNFGSSDLTNVEDSYARKEETSMKRLFKSNDNNHESIGTGIIKMSTTKINDENTVKKPGQSTTLLTDDEDGGYYRYFELEQEIAYLHSIFLSQKAKNKDSAMELRLLSENDWLEVQVRGWKYKLDELELMFNSTKKSYTNLVNALLKAQKENADSLEIHNMRELLRNSKIDAYEIRVLIKELNKVAWEMLPSKIADVCRAVDLKMENLRLKFEEVQLENHNVRITLTRTNNEILALHVAIEGEKKNKELYEMKIKKSNEIKENWKMRLIKLNKKINNGQQILNSYGLSIDAALHLKAEKKIKLYDNNDGEIEVDKESLKESIPNEKMTFFMEKLKEVENEILVAKSELERSRNENATIAEEHKKLMDFQKEMDTLKNTKKIYSFNLQQEIILRKTYYNEIEDLKGKIRVFCRCRPISQNEKSGNNYQCVSFPDMYTVLVQGLNIERQSKEFQFDRVFTMESTQVEIFADTSRLVQSAFDGYNVCIFAYGQTGSGKTYTLIGNMDSNPGIVPRAFDKIFQVIKDGKNKFETELKCYMLELYNDKLLDLVTMGAEYSDKLEIKKDVNGMVIVPGAELRPVASVGEMRDLFIKGNNNRHIASTKMNSESSRSHLILSIMINCRMVSSDKHVYGKMSIIDLAGSERTSKSGVKGVGAQEAMSINMSLSSLGDVISALTSGHPFVPYRNNKLTLLMQDSLGGNAKTLMFVNISPVDYNRIETISSLTYAARVKLIKNDALKVADADEVVKLQQLIELLTKGEKVII